MTKSTLCGVLLTACALLTCAKSQAATTTPQISPLSARTRAAMTGTSWKPGCPVPLSDLVAVRVAYVGFDSRTHRGVMVVHKRVAGDVVHIFAALERARFPIRTVAPWEKYGRNVYAEQDVTVGFYCEKADDDPRVWTSHSFGIAIDINPRENPFLNAHNAWWPASAAGNGRRDRGMGKVTTTSPVFRIFSSYGWFWGGFYSGERDYMHFVKLTVGGQGNPLERPYVVNRLQYVPGGTFEAREPTGKTP